MWIELVKWKMIGLPVDKLYLIQDLCKFKAQVYME